MARVVLIDDEPDIRLFCRRALEEAGNEIFAEAGDMETAKGIVQRCIGEGVTPVFVIDGDFPVRGQGEKLAGIIRKDIPHARIVSFSSEFQSWGDVNVPKGFDNLQKLPAVVSSLSSGQT